MKTTMKILSLLLVLVLALFTFAGCVTVEPGEGEEVVGGKTYVTITWMQGQRLIKEEVVEKGTLLNDWTPEGSGEFKGWYERPYIKKFDFSKPVTKSMIIYASFIGGDDGGVTEVETPDWYLIGAGKGDLGKCNNWNHEAAAANLGLVAGEDGIYRVTLSLYEGDQFKMTNNFGWDNEKAIDKMAGYANGSVKDANGNVVFTAGENNNFVVAEGMDGKYEITYDANADVMGFTFLEALEKMPDDIRLIGDNNGWGTSYGADDYKFTSNDNENWTLTYEVTSVPMTFKVYNNLSGVYYPGGVGNDLHIDVAGTYTIEFNSKTRNIVVKDENGNTVDVGFTGDNGGGDNGGSSVQPNANPVDKVYVVLDSAWDNGSTMGAWVWPGDTWADFVATANPNVYEVSVPAGANMIIFVDFNGSEKNWDDKRVQTADLAVPDKSDDKIYYHVSNGTWSNNAETPGESGGGSTGGNGPALTETITVYFENNWLWTNVSCYYWGDGISGIEWPGQAMTLAGTRDGHDVYAIELPVGVTGFIFNGVKDDGSGNLDQSPDISTSGVVNGSAWKMDWADGNLVTPITFDPNGENTDTPVVPNPDTPANGSVVYLTPNANWLESGARFAVYYWDGNGKEGWVDMTLVEGTLYTATVPTGNPNIIFCRMNPSAAANNWSNKWNQTSDLVLPTDGTNCYTVAEGAWDKGSGSWSTYEVGSCVHTPAGEPTVITAPSCTTEGQGSYVCSKCSETYTASIPATGHNYVNGTCSSCGLGSVYTVVGAAGLCGSAWDTTAAANDMTYDAATGVYTKVYENVAAGTYEYKVCLNHAWGAGEYPTGMNNNTVTVSVAGSTVTVTWNPATQTLEATVS